jgi:two-component system CheB/CheR fusion protein
MESSGMSSKEENSKEEPAGTRHPVIVAIGASAGGVGALQDFFAGLPDHTGAAFVVVVHLDPEHRSELPKIISGRTQMPVIQVQDRQRLKANHVYVIPPDRRLQVVDHENLRGSIRRTTRQARPYRPAVSFRRGTFR